MIDRRDVLRAGALATLGTAGAVTAVPRPAAAAIGERDWRALEGELSAGATLYRPGQASYEALSVPFNHRYADVRPAGIVACAAAEDVCAAIGWARLQGIGVTPRSGLGHNYAGYSATTGLLLNMSRMKTIVVNRSEAAVQPRQYGPIEVTHNAGTVTVGAGITNGDLHPMLEERNMFVPTGRCPSVGVAGLVLGGGIGFSDKMFGLTCDRLVETTVVLADSSIVTCNQTSHPDLFWACRGGAGNNFGVHTSFTFRYEQFRGTVGFYQFRWSLASAVEVMATMQQIAVTTATDKRFHLRLGMGTAGLTPAEVTRNANVNAIGQFYGPADELARILAPALRIGTPSERKANSGSIRQLSPAAAGDLLGATTPLHQFAAKSAIIGAPLTQAQVQIMARRLVAWPGSRNPDGAGIAMFGFGGVINEVPVGRTAFVHRSGLFVFAAEAAWADEDPPVLARANVDWLSDFHRAVFSTGTRPTGAYQNFPDPDLNDWQQAYYGNNYPRLVQIKRAYDPAGFFSYGQSIGANSSH